MIKIGARRRKAFIAMLGALCAAMIITGYAQTQKVDSLSTQVSMFAQKAVYETQELLAGLQLNLQKLLVSNSKAHRQSILDDIIKQSEAAADDLSMITWDMESVEGAIKFVNQTGDYASAMSRKISLGDDLDQTDINQISSMLSTCVSLNAEIIEGIRKLENGEIEVEFADTTNETEVEPAVNYPVLLYDGPFQTPSETRTLCLSETKLPWKTRATRLGALLARIALRVSTIPEPATLCQNATSSRLN